MAISSRNITQGQRQRPCQPLSINANSVLALKRAEVMPEIGGERWEQICEAINELSSRDEKYTPFDLIEYVPNKSKSINECNAENLTKISVA